MLDFDDTAGLRPGDARPPTAPPARDPARHGGAQAEPADATRPERPRTVLVAAAVVGAAIVLRTIAPEGLWLDEAQAVAIARSPLDEIADALRQDGAPPLYYVVLHLWMDVFGTGDVAVRSLSALLGIGSVPLAWFAGRTVGSRRAALVATLVVATSPFAIRYATEARMYSAVLALVLAGIVLVDRDRRAATPSWWRSSGVAAISGALLLTHYWSAFLLLAALLVLTVDARTNRAGRRTAAAIAAGGLALVPWVPSLLTQLRHTGAPWGRPPGPEVAELVAEGFGGTRPWGSLLAVLLVLACGVTLARSAGLQPDPGGGAGTASALLVVAALTLVLGALALQVSGEGFAPRHAAVAFGPFAVGIASAADALRPVPRHVLFGAIAILGLVAATTSARTPRTQAVQIAARLAASAESGDVVVLCPDQLAPALHRVLPELDAPTTVLVPAGGSLDRVDWTDYRDRVRAIRPATMARRLHERAGAATVWFVTSPVYTQVGSRCTALRQELRELRPAMRSVVQRRPSVYENAGLWRAPSPVQENP